ncbi:MAG: TraR/DksA C4-type zinc finger protein [Actinomycetota bacterium]|nr:TraR/DksA C4-type zinc finger protein [Actinomycetota bacterium]
MPNDAPTVDYRRLLEEEGAQLRAQLAELGVGEGAGGLAFDPNFADSSQVTAERGELETLVNQLRDSLGEVAHALEKLAEGEYGRCEVCGNAIGEARLEAMPATRFCIEHASRH